MVFVASTSKALFGARAVKVAASLHHRPTLLKRSSLDVARSFITTGSNSDSSTQKYDTPLELIQSATSLLQEVSRRLQSVSATVDASFKLGTGKQVTLKDIVLHSRDCATLDEFSQLVAVNAREQTLPIAESVESELQQLSQYFTNTVQPTMRAAAQVCQELPCGGATWVVDFGKAVQQNEKEIRIEGTDTPCGILSAASMDFVQTTYDTKQQVILGARSALILRLSMELNAPLTHVRDNNPEHKVRLSQAFSEVVPTPWLRSNEEYQQFLRMREQEQEQQQKQS